MPFWVADQHMDELLLGSPLLKFIGIGLDKLLAVLVEEDPVIDIAVTLSMDINRSPLRLATDPYKAIWYSYIDGAHESYGRGKGELGKNAV